MGKRGKLLSFFAICIITVVMSSVLIACAKEHSHEWGEWEVTKETTCLAEGEQQRKCTTCEEIDKQAIASPAHTYDGSVKCTVCRHECEHISVDDNDTCAVCKVIVKNEITFYYRLNGAEAILTGYEGVAEEIEIAESITINDTEYKVTGIGDQAFYHNRIVLSITIPQGVTSIGKEAFTNCTALESINIPSTVKRIGEFAFFRCESLKSIAIPDGVTEIGEYTFNDCTALNSINIPESVTKIGNRAFENCSFLTSITLPKSLSDIGKYVFRGCERLTINCVMESKPTNWDNNWNILKDSGKPVGFVQVVWDYPKNQIAEDGLLYHTAENGVKYSISFDTKTATVEGINDSNITQIELLSAITYNQTEYKVTAIGEGAFSDCEVLTDINIPESVTNIASEAFAYCYELINVNIPSSIVRIENGTFQYCYALENISIPDGVTYIGEDAFEGCAFRELKLPASLITIDAAAFYECEVLESIDIPNNVTYIGDNAFGYCIALTEMTIPDNVTSMGYGVFSNCEALQSITLSNNLTSIEDNAFAYCNSLSNIVIPNSVVSIGEWAFSKCFNLSEVIIPITVESIGKYAFEMYSSLTIYCEAVSVPAGWANNWNFGCPYVLDYTNNETADDGKIYYVANEGNGIRYALKDGIASVVRQRKNISGAIDIPSSIQYKNIDYRVTCIGEEAFKECSSLSSVTIANSVTAIEDSAFSKCSSLTTIVIPISVINMGGWVFSNCNKLTIYCEVEESNIPFGWSEYWNNSKLPVEWGYKVM